jgi:GxxExxY protein
MTDEEASYAVIGAAIDVHRALGPGYAESVYEEALGIELAAREIPSVRQYPFQVEYRGRWVGEGRVDFLVAGCLVVELKVVERVAPVHSAQVTGYLKALKLRLGLILNFNSSILREGIVRVMV